MEATWSLVRRIYHSNTLMIRLILSVQELLVDTVRPCPVGQLHYLRHMVYQGTLCWWFDLGICLSPKSCWNTVLNLFWFISCLDSMIPVGPWLFNHRISPRSPAAGSGCGGDSEAFCRRAVNSMSFLAMSRYLRNCRHVFRNLKYIFIFLGIYPNMSKPESDILGCANEVGVVPQYMD